MVLALNGDEAAAYAVKQCKPDVIAAYPITPQTIIVERLSEFVADGELDAEFISAESEHSALSACIGASAMGARTYTATASQGLALMYEMLFVASSFRLPIVMSVANRALNSPLNIWNDMSDTMGARDCGWIQIYNENAQEVYDFTIQAFRIAEDHGVLLPVMVCHDGFIVSHSTEGVETLSDSEVDSFLPPRDPVYPLDVERPVTIGCVGVPEYYPEIKYQQEVATKKSISKIKEIMNEFNEDFGRNYGIIEEYRMEDAEVAILTIGSASGTAKDAVDEMRTEGKPVGLLKLRLFRPLPVKDLRKALSDVKVVGVVDRHISFGALGGALNMEVRAALYEMKDRPHVMGFPTGLGGRDIRVEHFIKIADELLKIAERDMLEEDYRVVGCRGPGCIGP
ncbi:MAG: pyruvate ferredoxin oxidoreductase [Candidatus Freyarchaeota archaeon]|nr:pyruvate ferredoxin oxidoreductase [Candidatus Jordarchaeia archaeon]